MYTEYPIGILPIWEKVYLLELFDIPNHSRIIESPGVRYISNSRDTALLELEKVSAMLLSECRVFTALFSSKNVWDAVQELTSSSLLVVPLDTMTVVPAWNVIVIIKLRYV
jgi:hypothetical protein